MIKIQPIRAKPRGTWTNESGELWFEGRVTGIPAPSVQWTWRGLPLQEAEGKEGKGKKTWYDEKTGRVVLLIRDLGPGDEGDYQCRADNPYGDSTCTITVCSSLSY